MITDGNLGSFLYSCLRYHKHDPISNDFVTEKSHDVAISSVRDDSSTLAEPLTDSERLLSAWPTFERLMNGAKELWDMAQERMEQYTVEQMRVYKVDAHVCCKKCKLPQQKQYAVVL